MFQLEEAGVEDICWLCSGFIGFQIEERGHKADPSDVCKSTLYFLDIFPYQVGLFESPKENII